MKIIHKRTQFTKDHMYIRDVLSQAMRLHAVGNFNELAEVYNELAGVCASLSAMAFDNHHGIENADLHDLLGDNK